MAQRRLAQQEFEALVVLDAVARYTYTIKRLVDEQEAWSLRTDAGWVVAGLDDGQEAVPIWPHDQLAAACATGPWEGAAPTPIDLATFRARWLPGMERDRRSVAIFPTSRDKGVVVAQDRLKADLDAEAERYDS